MGLDHWMIGRGEESEFATWLSQSGGLEMHQEILRRNNSSPRKSLRKPHPKVFTRNCQYGDVNQGSAGMTKKHSIV